MFSRLRWNMFDNGFETVTIYVLFSSMLLSSNGWVLAAWLERLTINAKVAGFDPSILRHRGIWGAADGTVLNKVHKNIPLLMLLTQVKISVHRQWYNPTCTSITPYYSAVIVLFLQFYSTWTVLLIDTEVSFWPVGIKFRIAWTFYGLHSWSVLAVNFWNIWVFVLDENVLRKGRVEIFA